MTLDDRESQSGSPFVSPDEADASRARARIEPPPRTVLEAACRRDPAALEAFFDAYFGPVFAFASRLLGDRSGAEDVTQEVFLKVHRALETLDPARDPWPWIATIVHNACRDRWRSGAYRMARRSDSLDDDPVRAERLASPGGDPESLAIASERERRVRDAIERLPEAHRQLVLLYDYEGLSHLEVAAMLGIGHAAARKRYSRALEALGRILREVRDGEAGRDLGSTER